MNRPSVIGGVLTAALFAAPASHAAVTVGEVAPGTTNACGTTQLARQALQLSGAGSKTGTIPSSGVITQWRSAGAAAGAAPGVSLLVVRHENDDPGFYSIVDASPQETLPQGAVGTFATRIPVETGDVIGLDVRTASAPCLYSGAGTVALSSFSQPFVPKPPYNPLYGFGGMTASPARVNLAVTVEPDADGDGYGDETQDGCPADATTAGSCPVPPGDGVPGGGGGGGGGSQPPSDVPIAIGTPSGSGTPATPNAPATPSGTLTVKAPTLKARKGGQASGSFTAPTAGRLTWTGSAGKTVVTRGAVTVKQGKRTVTVRLNAAGKRVLKKKRRLSVKVTFAFTPNGGKPVRVSRTVKLVA